MADVMNSLFGMTPESIQRQRDNELQARALQFAKLDPQQAAQMAFYTAGSRLGDAGAGLLGAKDPEMMRLQQRQGTMQGLDLTDPASLKQGIQMAMQNNDYALVSELTNRYQAVNKSALDADVQRSVITKNQRERAAADPFQQLLRSGKYTPASLEAYEKSGKVSDLDTVDKADPTALTETSEGVFLINKQTGEKIARVGSTPQRGTKVTVAPEIKQAPDIVGAVNAVDKATEKEVSMLDSARLAKTLINETAKSNNSQTWEAARTTVAKAVGESKLSNEDIRRTGVDPRLVQGALDWVNKKIEGVPNADIQKQLYVLGSVLENSASSRYDAKVNRYRGAATASNFPGNPSTYFPTAAERTGGANAPKAVDWSSLK
jgi:hypothetical protein